MKNTMQVIDLLIACDEWQELNCMAHEVGLHTLIMHGKDNKYILASLTEDIDTYQKDKFISWVEYEDSRDIDFERLVYILYLNESDDIRVHSVNPC